MKIFILGPTGVGKTKLSISLAKIYDADVINCDAVQVYKYLNIGSAKITKKEMNGVVHHLFDIREPDQEYNVKDYQEDIRSIWNKYKNKNFICVGGTGLYATAAVYDYRFDNDLIDTDFCDKTNEELLKIANSGEEYQQIAKDVAKDILSSDRTEYYNSIKAKIENDEKIQQKMELTKSHPLYEDIHQIAGDIRFLKNLIIVGLVLGVVLILIGVFAMI